MMSKTNKVGEGLSGSFPGFLSVLNSKFIKDKFFDFVFLK